MIELWIVLWKPHTANFEISIFMDNSVQDKIKHDAKFWISKYLFINFTLAQIALFLSLVNLNKSGKS